jgi:uncharacterized membrane protein YdjX (TVP38/TMEM64 family)
VWATIYSLMGSFLASLVIFFLARRVGSRALRRLVGTDYGAVERVTRQSAFRFAFVSCLSPLLPTDVAQAAAFSAGAGFFRVALGVILGSLPGTFLTAAFGSALGQGKTILTTLTVIGIGLSLWLGVWIARRLSREVKAERRRQRPTGDGPGSERLGLPAVHVQERTVEIAAPGAGHEGHQGGDVGRLPQPD